MNSTQLYFLSDIHLGIGAPEVERFKQDRLLKLFSEIREKAFALYIVGDLFDFWFEYKHVVPAGHHRVLAGLEGIARAGVPVTYLAGNHDFAIGRFLRDEIGCAIVPGDLGLTHDGHRFYLHHGDGLAVNDGGYRIVKRILRNPFAQWAFRWIHPDLGFALAHSVSHTSRGYTSGKWFGVEDGLKLEAGRRIAEGYDFVIMGHRHLPCREEIDGGLYVNLGDWITHFTYAVYEDSTIRVFEMTGDEPRPYL